MRTNRILRAAAVLSVVVLAAAACGKSGGGGETAKGVTASYNAALTGVVNKSDHKGGTLKLLASGDFDSLDPGRTYYAYSWNYQRMYQRTLMAFNPVPGKEGSKVVPDIATAKGEVTNGGKTITYHIKSDLKYSDGTPITSADIKYAVERVFASDVISGGPASYYVALLDGVNGAKPYLGPYKDKAGLAAIETPNDTTIVFNLNKAFSDFDYLMAMPVSTPVPAKVDQDGKTGGANYQFHVVTSGPYKIQTYQPNKQLTLVRNENWGNDSLRKALPDVIQLTEGLDPDDMDNRVLAGTADMTVEGTGMQPTAVTKVLRGKGTLDRYADNPNTGFTRYFSIQEKVKPFDNIHCRKAVQYAADKVALQFARGGPVAGGDIATQMLPPTLPSYETFDLYPNGADHKGDVAKAKAELVLCGKPTGFTTKIATVNKGKGPKVAIALQQALAKVGIDAKLAETDSASYYSGFIGSPSNVARLGLGIAVAGWGPDFPTEYGFWESIVDGRAIKSSGNTNYAELNDPAINNLIDEILKTTDDAKKTDMWKQVARKVMESADLLPFVVDKALDYHGPRVTNVYMDSAFGMYDYMNLGVTA